MASGLKALFERVAALSVEQDVGRASTADEAVQNSTEIARLKQALEEAAASGELLYSGIRWATIGISLAGGVLGFGSLMALTAGSGETPINVLWLIGLAMLIPACTALLSMIGTVLFLRKKHPHEHPGLMLDLVRALISRGVRLAARGLEKSDPRYRQHLDAAQGALAGNYALIAPVVPWVLLRVGQYFALWLSVGFCAALLLRLATMDLIFGWYTTMDWVSEQMPQIVRALGAPFAWIHPDLEVPQALVRASQFSRYRQVFVDDPYAVAHNGAWWPFLVLGVTFWGMLPRLSILTWVRWKERREIARILKDTEPIYEIRQRIQRQNAGGSLFESIDGEDGTDPLQMLAEAAARGRHAQSTQNIPERPPDSPRQDAAFLYWEQDVAPPNPVIERMENSLSVNNIFQATWGNDAEIDAEILQTIGTLSPAVVCVFVEPFANPGAGFRRQMNLLRSVCGKYTPIMIHIGWYASDGSMRPHVDNQVKIWEQSIEALADRMIQRVRISEGVSTLRLDQE